MEDQEIYHVLPDSPISVLEMFGTSKEQINLFASKVINSVEDGQIDPLKVRVLCNTLKEIAEKIDKGTKENQAVAAALHGDKPFSFMGAELHYTATKTEYDFEHCNDSTLDDLEEKLKGYKELVDARKTFLKGLTQAMPFVNEKTGEVEVLSPPQKKQSYGVKVTIK